MRKSTCASANCGYLVNNLWKYVGKKCVRASTDFVSIAHSPAGTCTTSLLYPQHTTPPSTPLSTAKYLVSPLFYRLLSPLSTVPITTTTNSF